MKNLIAVIFIILSTNVLAQDVEMLTFVNQYRTFNGKQPFVWSSELAEVSKNQTNTIVNQDSLSHSHITSEIATMGKSLPSTVDLKAKFVEFIKTVFDIDYVEPENDSAVVTYVKLYSIFMFDQSPKHKAILLGDHKYIGFDVVACNIAHKSNTVTIGGKTVEYKKFVSHYEVNFCVVMNFKSE